MLARPRIPTLPWLSQPGWYWTLLLWVIGVLGLILHARHYDFLCDDGFIALRYAQNLVEHHELVYNLGERVEGHTSVLWVLLLALGHQLGVVLPTAASWLGALGGSLLLAFSLMLLSCLGSRGRLPQLALLSVLAMCSPIAAWTMGGLETPWFAALLVASVVAVSHYLTEPTRNRALGAALLLALTVLARPEGAIVMAVACAWSLVRPRAHRVWLLVGCGLFVAGYELWRWRCYGALVPNSFTVKTSGDWVERAELGLSYLGFFAQEMGPLFVALVVLGLVVPTPGQTNTARITRHLVRTLCLVWVPYLTWIGGDFLDLYRFLVPLMPLGVAGLVAAVEHWLRTRPSWILPVRGLVLFVLLGYGWQQKELAERALQIREPSRAERGIEPLGWTREYALRWAATGRWLKAHSEPRDLLAVGAAGAMPFYSGLSNIDTFGLCDAYVARHGHLLGVRPGHQRFAPMRYLVGRQPTFLLVGDYASSRPRELRLDATFGYVWVEARVSRAKHQAPVDFFHYFLMRRDRALTLRGSPDFRMATPNVS